MKTVKQYVNFENTEKCITRFCKMTDTKRTPSLFMDMHYSNVNATRLIQFDDANFLHDMWGIITNMNRTTKQLDNGFVPRAGFFHEDDYYYSVLGNEITKEQYYAERDRLYKNAPELKPGSDTHYIIAAELRDDGFYYLIDQIIVGSENLQKYVRKENPAYILARHSK